VKTLAKIICLTGQSNGSGGFRLGINRMDSEKYFKRRGRKVIIVIKSIPRINCRTACGIIDWQKGNEKKGKKSYDLNNKLLSKWIKRKNPRGWKSGEPPHFSFSLKYNMSEDVFILEDLNKKCKNSP
jgi:hypothetical protein